PPTPPNTGCLGNENANPFDMSVTSAIAIASCGAPAVLWFLKMNRALTPGDTLIEPLTLMNGPGLFVQSRVSMMAWATTEALKLTLGLKAPWTDRKSTRLNSSHVSISYAVFCLKKKK